MVVKWTSDKDQFVLNHLLTDPTIKIGNDVLDAMIQTWPAPFGPPPTRKAFTEHFSKIRKNSKTLLAGTGTGAAPSTPQTAKKPTAAAKRGSTTNKRKKPMITSSDSDDDNEAPPTKTPAKRRKQVTADNEDIQKEMAELGVKVKDEPVDDEDTPSKPTRRTAAAKITKYTDSDDAEIGGHPEDAENGSEDEYVDKEVVDKMSAYLESPDSEDEAEV